jgi:hypothetical protein
VAALLAQGRNVRVCVRALGANFPSSVEQCATGDFGERPDFAAALEGVERVVHLAGVAHRAAKPDEHQRITAQATYNASPNVVKYHVSAEDADNGTAFSTLPADNMHASTRARTTADAGPWTLTSVTGDTNYSRSVTSVVQEIVDRAGWVSGNALVIILDTHADTTQGEWQDFWSYDGSSSKAAYLEIEYSSGGTAYTLAVDAVSTTIAAGSVEPKASLLTGVDTASTTITAGSVSPKASLQASVSAASTGITAGSVEPNAGLLASVDTASASIAVGAVALGSSFVVGVDAASTTITADDVTLVSSSGGTAYTLAIDTTSTTATAGAVGLVLTAGVPVDTASTTATAGSVGLLAGLALGVSTAISTITAGAVGVTASLLMGVGTASTTIAAADVSLELFNVLTTPVRTLTALDASGTLTVNSNPALTLHAANGGLTA